MCRCSENVGSLDRSRLQRCRWPALRFLSTIVHVTDLQYRLPLHLMLNLPKIMTGMTRAESQDPQRDPFPLLSLPTSRLWLLQTLYRPIFQIFHLFPQCPLPLFRETHATTTPSPPAPTHQRSWDEGEMYDLERVEVWECFARND